VLECARCPRGSPTLAESSPDLFLGPPQCGTERSPDDLYFCSNCHVILPPDPSHDLFALLGAPRHFDVSPPALELAFKAAQKQLHPDKFSARPEARACPLVVPAHCEPPSVALRRSSATPPHRLRA
jgi:hypothetical protein